VVVGVDHVSSIVAEELFSVSVGQSQEGGGCAKRGYVNVPARDSREYSTTEFSLLRLRYYRMAYEKNPKYPKTLKT
jgi:hypothetical protein